MKHSFFCIDGHTCGNPVRVVTGGAPFLQGASMSDKRQHFLAEFDWVRTGLMFEPRGHDVMSGSILYSPMREDCDLGILFIETSGCLPMCGHGTIGTVTAVIEHGLVTPKTPGVLRLDTPAGYVEARYHQVGPYVESVKLVNVPAFVAAKNLSVVCAELGRLQFDVAYGGNFYAIIEPQARFSDLADMRVSDLIRWSPSLRTAINEAYSFSHPQDNSIHSVSHILWTGTPRAPHATGRNAVFYGDKAIDRSPCGTGTSARMAQWVERGDLQLGDSFVHESIIGSLFTGCVEQLTTVGDFPAIVPSIEGWARITGLNTLFIDTRDPYAHGFQLPT